MVDTSRETRALQPEHIRKLKKKKGGKILVTVEDILFVFLAMQVLITTTIFFPRIYRSVDFFPQSIDF